MAVYRVNIGRAQRDFYEDFVPGSDWWELASSTRQSSDRARRGFARPARASERRGGPLQSPARGASAGGVQIK